MKSSASSTESPSLSDLASKDRALLASVNKRASIDVDLIANKMAVEVAFLLSEQVEDLNVYTGDFRRKLFDVCKWALVNLAKRQERCVVLPDCIPGFTLMGFKKNPENGIEALPCSGAAPPTVNSDSSALAMLIDRFLGRSSNMCLVIDCDDVLLTLFPVADIKRNLKILGFEQG